MVSGGAVLLWHATVVCCQQHATELTVQHMGSNDKAVPGMA